RPLHSFPTRRSSDLLADLRPRQVIGGKRPTAPRGQRRKFDGVGPEDPGIWKLDTVETCPTINRGSVRSLAAPPGALRRGRPAARSEEHTSELQSREN